MKSIGRSIDSWGLFRALRSGLRPHTRSGGYAADSIGRYALTQPALAILEFFEQLSHRDVELLGCLVGAVGDGVADTLHQLIPNVR